MSIAHFTYGSEILFDDERYVIDIQPRQNIRQIKNIITGEVITVCDEDLISYYLSGRIKFADTKKNFLNIKYTQESTLDMFPDEIQEIVQFRYSFIQEIQKQKITTLTKNSLEPIINQVINFQYKNRKKPSWSTIYNWCRRFEEGNNDIRALIPLIRKRGNRRNRFPIEFTELCEKAINYEYLRLERGTINATFDRAITLIAQENENRTPSDKLPLPTKNYIKRLIEKIPAYDRDKARYGKLFADHKYRSVLKHNTADKRLDRAEIDHTTFDIFVIDERSNLPLGRPTLTILIDLKTRCILGFYIGFYDPSFVAVSQCLKHAFLPKEKIDSTELPIENNWVPFGIPREITVDNGMEFHSKNFEYLCQSYNITIRYAARRRAWYKGSVERLIGTLTRQTAHTLPGTTFSNIFEKKDYDSLENGVITLEQLRSVITKWVVDIYHVDNHSSLNTSPIDAWTKESNLNEIPIPASIDDLECLIGASEQRTLTHKGIELFYLSYNSPELNELRLKYGEKLKVIVRYNPLNLGHIFVFRDAHSAAIKVRCLSFKYADGLSEYQHGLCKKVSKKKFSRTDIESLAKAKVMIQDYVRKDLFNRKTKHKKRIKKLTDNPQTQQIGNNIESDIYWNLNNKPTEETQKLLIKQKSKTVIPNLKVETIKNQ